LSRRRVWSNDGVRANLLKYVDKLENTIIKSTPRICALCCYAPGSSMHDYMHSALALEVIEGIFRPSFWNSTHSYLNAFRFNLLPATSNIIRRSTP
jgi:hypothetical protein